MYEQRNNQITLRSAAKSFPRVTSTITSEAFGDAYQNGGYKLSLRVLQKSGVGDVAEDLAQAAWLRCWKKRAQLCEPRSVVPWATTTARREIRPELRTTKRFCQLDESHDVAGASISGQEAVETAIDVSLIQKLCTPRQWHLLKRVHLDESEPEDVAREMGISRNALNKRLGRVYRALRKKITGRRPARPGGTDGSGYA